MVVLRDQHRRALGLDLVERLARRRAVGPVGVAPALAAQPAPVARRLRARGRAPRRATRSRAARRRFCESAHVGKWTCESVKPGRTHRPPRSTVSGLGSEVSCTPTPPAIRSPAIQSDETVGSDGSSVRIVPLRRIMWAMFDHVGSTCATSSAAGPSTAGLEPLGCSVPGGMARAVSSGSRSAAVRHRHARRVHCEETVAAAGASAAPHGSAAGAYHPPRLRSSSTRTAHVEAVCHEG